MRMYIKFVRFLIMSRFQCNTYMLMFRRKVDPSDQSSDGSKNEEPTMDVCDEV